MVVSIYAVGAIDPNGELFKKIIELQVNHPWITVLSVVILLAILFVRFALYWYHR